MDGLELALEVSGQKLEWLPSDDGKRQSLLWTHQNFRTPNIECAAVVDIAPDGSRKFNDQHQLTSLKPLTIMPSLLCPTCGEHGFVKADLWQPSHTAPGPIRPMLFRIDRIVATATRGVWKVVLGGNR